MPYLIDGHNLISYLDDIDLDDPNDEAKLVLKLRGFAARTRKKCVVVFDHGLPGGASRLSTSHIKVIFASAGATNADRIIMERIRETRDIKGWTVVSSDNEVLAAAEAHGMRGIRSVEFASLLARPKKPGVDTATNAYVSPKEVEEWLEIFGDDAPDYTRSTILDNLPPPMPEKEANSEASSQTNESIAEDQTSTTEPEISKKRKHEQPKSVGKYAKRSPNANGAYDLNDEDLDLWQRTYGSYKRTLQDESAHQSHKATQTPSKKSKNKKSDVHRKGDPHLSQDEIDEWLSMFGEDDD